MSLSEIPNMDKWWASARNMTDDLGLELEGIDVKRILKYFEKIRLSEIMYCEDHDREFPESEECPGCRSEQDDHEIEEACFGSGKRDD